MYKLTCFFVSFSPLIQQVATLATWMPGCIYRINGKTPFKPRQKSPKSLSQDLIKCLGFVIEKQMPPPQIILHCWIECDWLIMTCKNRAHKIGPSSVIHNIIILSAYHVIFSHYSTITYQPSYKLTCGGAQFVSIFPCFCGSNYKYSKAVHFWESQIR